MRINSWEHLYYMMGGIAMIVNNEAKELNVNELENVTGGLVVDGGLALSWVVDDKTGEILKTDFYTSKCYHWAEEHGHSTEIISRQEYKRRFNK